MSGCNRLDEAAEVLGISLKTAKRDWTMAKTWLFAVLTGEPRIDSF